MLSRKIKHATITNNNTKGASWRVSFHQNHADDDGFVRPLVVAENDS